MTTFSQEEQLQLEMINRARMDPDAEAARLSGVTGTNFDMNGGVAPGSITSAPKQVLAGNNTLASVAEKHSAQILTAGKLDQDPNTRPNPHNGVGDSDPSDRISKAGYVETIPNGKFFHPENVAVAQTTLALDQKTSTAENELMHNNYMIDSNETDKGHRLAIMDADVREIGIGEVTGQVHDWKPGSAFIFNTQVMTEDFGMPGGNKSFLTGAVYNDSDGDHFYDLGEAVSNVTASVKTTAGAAVGSDVTGAGGGWSVSETGGTFQVSFSGGGLAREVSATVEGGNLNAKVDLVNGNEIDSNVNTTLGDGAKDLRLLGMDNVNATGNAGDNVITGNRGNNILTGGGGNDTIDGGAGTDTVVFFGKLSDYQVTVNGGTATLKDLRAGSADGIDTITNIEQVTFADGTVAYSSLKTTAAPPPAVAGSVRIDDVTVVEGNNGTKTALFHVSRDGTAAFDVHYATAAGTASGADGDYVATSNTLHFSVDEIRKTIAITINGDTKVEDTETFKVLLSNATNGAVIADGTGIGTITNDDTKLPSVSIGDASVVEGNSGTQVMKFTVTRTDGDQAFDVHYATATGTASGAAGDYVAKGETLHFIAGEMQKTVSITINGDTKVEGNETFKVVLSDATNGARIVDDTGVGTIIDNDKSHAAEDFNGDGNSDILFHNAKTGAVGEWQMNGTKATSIAAGTQATSWHAIDTFDFNGDGKSDILWQNDNGQVQVWQMDGATKTQVTNLGSMASNWHIGAVDDFNANGKADIVWFSDAGQVKMELDGASTSTTQTVGTIGAGWHIQDAADFNGDGKADLLLRNDAGATALWTMDGNKVVSSQSFGSIGTDWHFKGAADFGGDGKADILWENDNGSLALWQMNGTKFIGNDVFGHLAAGYHVADVGDYNHDGKADIVMQNAAGAMAEWQMDGAHVTSTVSIGSIATDWHMH